MSPFAASRHDAGLEPRCCRGRRENQHRGCDRPKTQNAFGKHIATQHMTRTHELHAWPELAQRQRIVMLRCNKAISAAHLKEILPWKMPAALASPATLVSVYPRSSRRFCRLLPRRWRAHRRRGAAIRWPIDGARRSRGGGAPTGGRRVIGAPNHPKSCAASGCAIAMLHPAATIRLHDAFSQHF